MPTATRWLLALDYAIIFSAPLWVRKSIPSLTVLLLAPPSIITIVVLLVIRIAKRRRTQEGLASILIDALLFLFWFMLVAILTFGGPMFF